MMCTRAIKHTINITLPICIILQFFQEIRTIMKCFAAQNKLVALSTAIVPRSTVHSPVCLHHFRWQRPKQVDIIMFMNTDLLYRKVIDESVYKWITGIGKEMRAAGRPLFQD